MLCRSEMAESEIKQRPSHIVDKEEKKSLVIRKICDLEDRVHDLEEQERKSKKALETALQQNNYLEKCIRNLGRETVKSNSLMVFQIFSLQKPN